MQYQPLTDIKKILVLSPHTISDFLLSLPALTALRKTYQQADIALLGTTWQQQFFAKRESPIDRVILTPDMKSSDAVSQLQEKLQQEKFDIALQMHDDGHETNGFTASIDALLTIGFQGDTAPPLAVNLPYTIYQHKILRFLELVECTGARTEYIEPSLSVTPADKKEAIRFVNPLMPYAVIHPGVLDIRRSWPPERFAAVANALQANGLRIVLTGDAHDAVLLSRIQQLLNRKAVSLAGKLSLSGLTGVVAKAAIVIASEPTILHLAQATCAPTVGIYWSVDNMTDGPLMQSLHKVAISWQIHCPLCDVNCATPTVFPSLITCAHNVSFLTSISAQEVTTQALSLLAAIPLIKTRQNSVTIETVSENEQMYPQ